ncbi:hypothetical protein ACWC2T_33325 [Streptomyces sp. NPDC001393]
MARFGLAGFVAGVVGLRGGLPNAGVREAGYAIALILGPLAVGYAVAAKRDLAEAMGARVVALDSSTSWAPGAVSRRSASPTARDWTTPEPDS